MRPSLSADVRCPMPAPRSDPAWFCPRSGARFVALLAGLVTVAGCGDKDACAAVEAAPMGGCLGGEDELWYGSAPFELSGEAVVEAVGPDTLPNCTVWMRGLGNEDLTLVGLRRDTGTLVTIGLAGAAVPLEVGDAVRFDVGSVHTGAYAWEHGWIDLTREAGGRIVYATAGTVEGLHAPSGVTLSTGEELCGERDACGDWGVFALDVAVDGETATLRDGTPAEVGGWDVVNGGVVARTEPARGCLDHFPAGAEVLLVKG